MRSSRAQPLTGAERVEYSRYTEEVDGVARGMRPSRHWARARPAEVGL